jgi:hypothetical protein
VEIIVYSNWSCEMQVVGEDAAVGNCSASGCTPPSVEDDDDFDFENWDVDDDAGAREHNSDSSGDEVDDTLSLVR